MGSQKSEIRCLSSISGSQAHCSRNILVNGEADSGLVSGGKLLHQLAIHVILEHGHVAYIDLVCQLCALIIPAGTQCWWQAGRLHRGMHHTSTAEVAAGQAQLDKVHARAPRRSTAWPIMVVMQTDTSSHRTCPHALALAWRGRQHTAAQAPQQP